jgi:hypothetical protein
VHKPGKLHRSAGSGKKHRALLLVGLGLAGSLGVLGCDTLKSWLPGKDDPPHVLVRSTDGNKRAKGYGELRVSEGKDATKEQNDAVIEVLATAATTEPQCWCRLKAIESLSKIQDPRATQALIDAYYKAEGFPPETRTVVRCQAISALGKLKDPAAVDLLVTVVKAPPVEAASSSESEKQLYLDERLAAARALENYNHARATEALVQVLKTEKDVGLRGRAHESLMTATGKKLPAEFEVWDRALHPEAKPTAAVADQNRAPILGKPIQLTGARDGKPPR